MLSGKFNYCVLGVITQDKEGNQLKTKKGNAYKKLKIAVIDNDGMSNHVYDYIFSVERVAQIVRSVGVESINRKFKEKKLDLNDLVGHQGECIVGIKRGNNGYSDSNVIEVYVAKNEDPIKNESSGASIKTQGQAQAGAQIELEPADDGLPF